MRIKYDEKVTYYIYDIVYNDKHVDEFIENYYFKDGKLDGESKMWHNNGQLYIHCHYKDDLLDGEWIAYSEYGYILKHLLYKNDYIIKEL